MDVAGGILSEEELKPKSHKDAMKIANSYFKTILEDPLLQDVSIDMNIEEIKAKIDLEKGKAFSINIVRDSENGKELVSVIVTENMTVHQLKRRLQQVLSRKICKEGGPSCLSWKYVWKTYWLVHQNEKLASNSNKLKDHGISEGSEIYFLKRLRRN